MKKKPFVLILLVIVLSVVGLVIFRGKRVAQEANVASDQPTSEIRTPTPYAQGMFENAYQLDPTKSKATYVANKYFLSSSNYTEVRGSASVQGAISFEIDSLPQAEGAFMVDLLQLASGTTQRDEHIKNEFLESKLYPTALLKFSSIEISDAELEKVRQGNTKDITFKLPAELTIHETTKQVVFDVVATIEGNTMSGKATTKLKGSDFGFEMPYITDFFKVDDEFGLEVEIVAGK